MSIFILAFLVLGLIVWIMISNKEKKKDNFEIIELTKTISESKELDFNLFSKMNNDFLEVCEQEKSTNNPKFHRTELEEELSFSFSQKYSHSIEKFEYNIYKNKFKIQDNNNIDARIKQCEKTIFSFYKFKEFCYGRKGGDIYFQDMWEYCHNSKNECFSYIEDVEVELRDLVENYSVWKDYYDNINRKTKKIKNFLSQYDPITEVLKIIIDNNGILQKNVYNYFDEDLRDIIKPIFSKLEKEKKIIREKKGNSFKLFIK